MGSLPYKYQCVNCGNKIEELFRIYSPSVLKMKECSQCHETADKYIEYDPVIVLIDLVLWNRRAYRHILFNTPFQTHWKLAIILLLIESYAEWAFTKDFNVRTEGIRSKHYDLFQGEQNFYLMFLKVFVGSASFFAFVFILTLLQFMLQLQAQPLNFRYSYLWKALVLSSFGKFLKIPALIWGEIGTNTHSMIILVYLFVSQVQAYSVTCGTSRIIGGAVILQGLIIQYLTEHLVF